jgi:predicted Zn-dependent protease
MGGQLQEAVKHLKKATALKPNDPDNLHWLALLYSLAGREDLGRPLSHRALLLDPLTAVHHAMPGWFDFLEGDAKAALAPFKKMYRMEPESPLSRFLYAVILAQNEKPQEALAVLDVLAKDSEGTVFGGWATFTASALRGRRDQALQAVTPTLASDAKWDAQVSWVMADTYALLDERESALEYLRNAAERGFINYRFLAYHDRFLENLRGDPQFQHFLGTVKNLWEAFEA